MSKEEKARVLKVTMGFKITMGDFISTTYLVNLTVDPSGMSTLVRLEGTKEARKVLGEHLERMVEKSHKILAERDELELANPSSNEEDIAERMGNLGMEVAKKAGKKQGASGKAGAEGCKVAISGPPSAPPSAPPPLPAPLPECPVCLQEMAPGDKIFQVFFQFHISLIANISDVYGKLPVWRRPSPVWNLSSESEVLSQQVNNSSSDHCKSCPSRHLLIAGVILAGKSKHIKNNHEHFRLVTFCPAGAVIR